MVHQCSLAAFAFWIYFYPIKKQNYFVYSLQLPTCKRSWKQSHMWAKHLKFKQKGNEKFWGLQDLKFLPKLRWSHIPECCNILPSTGVRCMPSKWNTEDGLKWSKVKVIYLWPQNLLVFLLLAWKHVTCTQHTISNFSHLEVLTWQSNCTVLFQGFRVYSYGCHTVIICISI